MKGCFYGSRLYESNRLRLRNRGGNNNEIETENKQEDSPPHNRQRPQEVQSID